MILLSLSADPIAPTVQPDVGAAVDNVRTVSVNFPPFDETNGQIRSVV